MTLDPCSRKARALVPALAVAAALAVGGRAAPLAAGDAAGPHLAGTWSGRYGGAFSGTFKLHWKQSGARLSGSIALSNPHGTYTVTGSVSGTAIRFGAVGAGATYTGSVSGSTMWGRLLHRIAVAPYGVDGVRARHSHRVARVPCVFGGLHLLCRRLPG